MREFIKNAVLLVLSVLFAFLLVEASDRIWLYHSQPDRFVQSMGDDATASFGFMNKATTTFNAEYGFDYKPNSTFISGSIVNGTLNACALWHTNSYGSFGRRDDGYDTADLKIVMVGSSFTGKAINGVTQSDVLQDMLSEKLGKRVSIKNMGRDGTGILSTLDVAAGEIDRSRPDLIIIPYITDMLIWDRVWRREEVVDGRDRVFTTTQPEFDLSRSVDREVIAPNEPITEEWCRKQPRPDKNDPIVRELLIRQRIAIAQANARADVFALDTSFVYNAIIHHDPFYKFNASARTALPPHNLRDFRDDRKAADDIRRLRNSGIPVVVFHMAKITELNKGVEFDFSDPVRESLLVKSLEEALGTTTWQTRELAGPIEHMDEFAETPGDPHPSIYGMKVYAHAIINGLEKAGLTGRGPVRLTSISTAIPMAPIVPFIAGSLQNKDNIKAADGRSIRLLSDPAQQAGSAEGYIVDRGVIKVLGWAVAQEDGGPAQYVVAISNGKLISWAKPEYPRADIATALGPTYRDCAFILTLAGIDTSALKSLRVYALSKARVGRELDYASSLR